jgi:pilus assembly protein Flp/PilA
MKRLISSVVHFLRCEDGPTAVEYAVMLSLIITVCLTAIAVLGHKASGAFTTVGQTLGAS